MLRVFAKIVLCLTVTGIGLVLGMVPANAAAERFNQAALRWYPVADASSYTIYYKESYQSGFTHSLAGIPAAASSYTVQYLKKGRVYWYTITAVDANGKEYLTTGLKRMSPTTMQ